MRVPAFCRLLIFLLTPVCAIASGQQASSVPTKENETTCAVSGMVVKAADGAPLKNAWIRLSVPNDREHNIAAKTNAEGKFELKNLPGGRYKMAVERNGYVTAEYGQRTISDPGAILTLTPGTNRTGLIFRMVSAAVISGRIFDGDGEPVPNAIVTAARDAYREGKRTLAIEASAQTNDLGEYRLYGMKPGSYYVAAVETSWRQVSVDRQYAAGNSQAPEQGHVKT